MKFIDNRKVEFRKIKEGDIILFGDSKYMIVFDVSNSMYKFINIDTGFCSTGFETINEIMSQFDSTARYYNNDEFKLILE